MKVSTEAGLLIGQEGREPVALEQLDPPAELLAEGGVK
jgi:hypothetical protein